MGRITTALALAAGILLGQPWSEADAQRRVPRVGFLCARPGPSSHTEAFERGLREHGYQLGKNVVIEYRYLPAGAPADRFTAFATELVRLGVSAIVVGSPIALEPARQATTTTPLVLAQSEDPVASGVVRSLARPGTNVTGLSSMAPELTAKQLEVLRSIVPGLVRAAVLWNPGSQAAGVQRAALEKTARQLGVTLEFLDVDRAPDIERVVAGAARGRAQGLVVVPDMAFFDHLDLLVSAASRHRLPAIYGEREFAEAGGLVSYGTNYDDLFRRAAAYVDKVLRGARAAELPIEQPTKFELVLNARAAKRLGLPVPSELRLRADRVIE